MNRIVKILPSITLLLAICVSASLGQGFIVGGISGSVVDQTEAVIPGASIRVVELRLIRPLLQVVSKRRRRSFKYPTSL